jgi:DNA-binding CsgD family transcriptional regulator
VLADLIDPSTDCDRRAWHLAAAAAAPDEAVAGELERSAERAKQRGGWSSQAAFLSRAAELTPDQHMRTQRLLAASQAALVAGAPNRVRALLSRATQAPSDPLFDAQAKRIEAGLRSFTSPGDVPALLLDAARALERQDVRLARDTFAEALQSCVVSWQLTRNTTPKEVADAALAAPRSNESSGRIADLMIEAFSTRYAVGLPAAVPLLREAVTALCSTDTPPLGITRWAVLGNNAAADIFDAEGYRSMLVRLERAERESGALESLRVTLGGKGHCLMWSGDFVGANSAHSEAAEISISLGEDAVRWEMLKVELMAWQGRDSETRAIAGILTSEAAEGSGAGIAASLGRIALVILEMSHGHYADALVLARLVMEDDPPAQGSQVLPEVVEAAVRSGHPDLAVEAMARLTERAQASATPWALGLLARSRALVAEEDPESLYRQAIAHLQQTYVVTDLARAHLLYGEWLRRQKRRTDARAELRVAHSLFSDMGATAFAERARVELAATGERAKSRTDNTRTDLTNQEHQVALLAAQGLTNLEIAASLFLSAATVDYHLRKVYRKLAINSRRELRHAFA